MVPDNARSPRQGKPGAPRLSVFAAIFITAALMALSAHGFLPDAPDKITYDWRTALFCKQAEVQRDDIAIVLVTEDSVLRYWSRSPVDRALLAELVRAIDLAGPRAIGLDFIFDRPADPKKTEALIRAIREARAPVVLGAIDRRERRVSSEALKLQETFLTEAGRPAGHLFYGSNRRRFALDEDVVRLMASPLTEPPQRESFARALAEQAVGRTVQEPRARHIAWLCPPDKSGMGLFAVLRVPEHDPVDGNGEGLTLLPESWRAVLKDKIVLVGGDFIDRDQHQTPMSILDRKRVPGVAIHGQIVAQLLDGRVIRPLSPLIEMVCVFVIAALGFYLGHRFRLKNYDLIVSSIGIMVLIGVGMAAFARWQLIVPSTTFFFAWVGGITLGHLAAVIATKTGYSS